MPPGHTPTQEKKESYDHCFGGLKKDSIDDAWSMVDFVQCTLVGNLGLLFESSIEHNKRIKLLLL